MKAEQQSSTQREAGMRRAETIFIRSVIVILAFTALAKLISASGGARALEATDPLFMLTHRQVFLSVGILELAIAAFLVFSTRHNLKVPVIAWLAGNFTVYRLGLYWIGAKLPCGCLGVLTEALGIAPKTADLWMKGVLAYLLLGAAFFLVSRAARIGTVVENASAAAARDIPCEPHTGRMV